MPKSFLRRGLVALAVVSGLALAGCAPSATTQEPVPPSTSSSSDALNQLIEDGLAEAGSDFQKEVLTKAKQSGEISEADWKEANNRYKSCMADQGYEVELVFQGSKVQTIRDAEEGETGDADNSVNRKRQQVDIECYAKTSAFINEVYDYINGTGSMDGDQIQRAVFKCLVDRGLVPKDTTYDEFLADLEQQGGKGFNPEGGPHEAEIRACWVETTT